jgi:hypothetical protein
VRAWPSEDAEKMEERCGRFFGVGEGERDAYLGGVQLGAAGAMGAVEAEAYESDGVRRVTLGTAS